MRVLVAFLLLVAGLATPATAGYTLVDLIAGRMRPDNGQPFYLFSTPVISGDTVVFLTSYSNAVDAVWRIDTKTRAIRKLAGLKSAVPGGTGTFTCFCQRYASDDVTPSVGGGQVAFYGVDKANRIGLYLVGLGGGTIRKVANSDDTSPDGTKWTRFGRVSLGDGIVAFRAETVDHRGIYTAPIATRVPALGIDERTRLTARRDDGAAIPQYYALYDTPVVGRDYTFFLSGGLFDPSTGPSSIFRLKGTRIFDNASKLAGGVAGAHLRIQAISAAVGARSVAFRADQPGTTFMGIFRPNGVNASVAFVTTKMKAAGFSTRLTDVGNFAYDTSGLAFMGTTDGVMLIGAVAKPGAAVQTVARGDKGYYKPTLGDRSISGGKIVFREDGGANRLMLAVPN